MHSLIVPERARRDLASIAMPAAGNPLAPPVGQRGVFKPASELLSGIQVVRDT